MPVICHAVLPNNRVASLVYLRRIAPLKLLLRSTIDRLTSKARRGSHHSKRMTGAARIAAMSATEVAVINAGVVTDGKIAAVVTDHFEEVTVAILLVLLCL